MTIDRRQLLTAATAFAALPGCARAMPPGTVRLRVAGDRLHLPATINGVAVEALLDSAAEKSIVDAALAHRLGLRGGEAVTARGTGAATAAATLATGATLAVAGLTLQPGTVGVIDLGDVARRLGSPVPLIVGRELFDAAAIALDIGRGALAILPSGSRHPGRHLPLTTRRGIETFPVTIEGIDAQAEFDLGNGGTILIGAAFAESHGLLVRRATTTIDGGGIGGATRQTSFTLRGLKLAGHRFTDVPAAIDASPTAADANIGVRLLRRFAIVAEFPARSLWLDDAGERE